MINPVGFIPTIQQNKRPLTKVQSCIKVKAEKCKNCGIKLTDFNVSDKHNLCKKCNAINTIQISGTKEQFTFAFYQLSSRKDYFVRDLEIARKENNQKRILECEKAIKDIECIMFQLIGVDNNG